MLVVFSGDIADLKFMENDNACFCQESISQLHHTPENTKDITRKFAQRNNSKV